MPRRDVRLQFGIFTYVTRVTRAMLDAVESRLAEANFVETFLPYVCQETFGKNHNTTNHKDGHPCRPTSLLCDDVGFFNNAGNLFCGQDSAINFAAVASVPHLS